jgi:hypothetical protein
MPNLPHWGRGNFHAVEHWLAHLFDHQDEREPISARHPPKKRAGMVRKRHPLEEIDDD